jgi:hypothetical protein
MQFLLLAALAVTLSTGSAKATTPWDDPKATLLSETVLQGALSDIAKMQEVRRKPAISRLRDPPEPAAPHVVPNRQALSSEEMALHDGL